MNDDTGDVIGVMCLRDESLDNCCLPTQSWRSEKRLLAMKQHTTLDDTLTPSQLSFECLVPTIVSRDVLVFGARRGGDALKHTGKVDTVQFIHVSLHIVSHGNVPSQRDQSVQWSVKW